MRKLVFAATLAISAGLTSSAWAAPEEEDSDDIAKCEGITATNFVKMRTMAPKGSRWATQFVKFAKQVRRKSDCKVDIEWTWNGGGRDEKAMVSDMKSGTLDGAAMTSVGLSDIVKDMLIFNLPGLFSNWAELDTVRNNERVYFEGKFDGAGFVLAGVGDVGAAKIMGTSDRWDDELWRPANLKDKGLSYITGDLIGPKFLEAAGASGTPVTINEIGSKLGKSITVLTTPPYAALQLGWSSKVRYVLKGITPYFSIGGIVFSKSKLDALPGEYKTMILELARKRGEKLTGTIRNEDAGAFKVIAKRCEEKVKNDESKGTSGGATTGTHDASDDEKSQWNSLFQQTRAGLKDQFSADLYQRVVTDRGK